MVLIFVGASWFRFLTLMRVGVSSFLGFELLVVALFRLLLGLVRVSAHDSDLVSKTC